MVDPGLTRGKNGEIVKKKRHKIKNCKHILVVYHVYVVGNTIWKVVKVIMI